MAPNRTLQQTITDCQSKGTLCTLDELNWCRMSGKPPSGVSLWAGGPAVRQRAQGVWGGGAGGPGCETVPTDELVVDRTPSSSFSGATGGSLRHFSSKMDARVVGIALGCAVSPIVSGRADKGTAAADISSDIAGPAPQQREVLASESWEEFEERCRSPAKDVRYIGVTQSLSVV